MKNFLTGILGLSVMAFVFACSQKQPKSATELLTEIDSKDAPNTLSGAEKKEGWKLLFDGTSTNGWHGYNLKVFPDCWAIEDGSFTMNTTGSAESLDIITNRIYRDFAFSLEYKLTKAANSGVIFQVAEDPKYKYPYETGPEFQVIDHQNWPDTLEELADQWCQLCNVPAGCSPI